MGIRYLHRKEIDEARWDAVIAASPAETLYPYSWYLDAAAENWSALVMDDYCFIMPLVWKRKYGIRYLYQPTFCQQLGVFSREFVDPLLIKDFLAAAMKGFRFGVVNFNAKNMVGEEHATSVYDRSNYILSLGNAYEEIASHYSTNTKRNLKKAMEREDVVADLEVGLPELFEFKRKQDALRRPEALYRHWEAQFDSVVRNREGHVFGMRKEGELIAACFLALSKTRIIYLLSISSEEGKESRAMFRIVDEVIRRWSGSAYTLDFEGSTIPSIARFFGSFGGRPEIYQSLSFNRFPLSFILGRNYGR